MKNKTYRIDFDKNQTIYKVELIKNGCCNGLGHNTICEVPYYGDYYVFVKADDIHSAIVNAEALMFKHIENKN